MSQDRHAHLPRRIANAHHASSPVSFLNPTTRYVKVPAKKQSKTPTGADGDIPSDNTAQEQQQQPPLSTLPPQTTQQQNHVHGAYQIWRSRDNRKGRHAIVLTNDFFRHRHLSLHGDHSPEGGKDTNKGSGAVPRSTDSWRGIAHILWKMLVRYPVWDVSYDVAIIFTIGSVVWVINSFFVWLPLAAPWTEFAGEETMGGGITAVIGASIFEVGAVLGLLEAVNENRADCFGWALEEALESGFLSLQPNPDDCKHAHVEQTRLFSRRRNGRHHKKDKDMGNGRKDGIPESSVGGKPITEVADDGNVNTSSSDLDNANTSPDTGSDDTRIHPQRRRWTWWPSWTELRTVYAREMGFWACLIQLFGATVFWISGFTGLPPIADRLSTAGTNGAFWAPQVIGGTGFIVSSWLFMLETQRKWYLPAPHLLGWHIGLWNMIGAIGFTLCGALGFGAATSAAVTYASTLSTFIGSWAFLIGSIIQWYESLDKHPIQIQDSLPNHVPP